MTSFPSNWILKNNKKKIYIYIDFLKFKLYQTAVYFSFLSHFLFEIYIRYSSFDIILSYSLICKDVFLNHYPPIICKEKVKESWFVVLCFVFKLIFKHISDNTLINGRLFVSCLWNLCLIPPIFLSPFLNC